MQQVAALAEKGWEALQRRDVHQLAALMKQNFQLRRHIYGDEFVGAANLAMVEAAQSVGAAAKLSGSGGAVVALCPDGAQQEQWLLQACQERGLVCEEVVVGPTLFWAGDREK
jgi:glucuronokinase